MSCEYFMLSNVVYKIRINVISLVLDIVICIVYSIYVLHCVLSAVTACAWTIALAVIYTDATKRSVCCVRRSKLRSAHRSHRTPHAYLSTSHTSDRFFVFTACEHFEIAQRMHTRGGNVRLHGKTWLYVQKAYTLPSVPLLSLCCSFLLMLLCCCWYCETCWDNVHCCCCMAVRLPCTTHIHKHNRVCWLSIYRARALLLEARGNAAEHSITTPVAEDKYYNE